MCCHSNVCKLVLIVCLLTCFKSYVYVSVQLPKFIGLCKDTTWAVRKACAENFMPVSCVVSRDTRCRELSENYMILLKDESRWVSVIFVILCIQHFLYCHCVSHILLNTKFWQFWLYINTSSMLYYFLIVSFEYFLTLCSVRSCSHFTCKSPNFLKIWLVVLYNCLPSLEMIHLQTFYADVFEHM